MTDDDQPAGEEVRADLLSTYRHLRLAMVLLLVLLLGSVLLQGLTVCSQGSISGFYFTSVRPVFVATLCGLGACLIVYRGDTDAEDIALNASGFLAFVVAFVPTARPSGRFCRPTNVPTKAQIEDLVANNMTVLFAVGFIALLVAVVLMARSQRNVKVPLTSLAVFSALGVAAWAWYAIWPAAFRKSAHSGAAVALFVGILVVVFLNGTAKARPVRRGALLRAPRLLYKVVGVSMVLTILLLGLGMLLDIRDDDWFWRFWVLAIEAALLVEFLVFWLVQTDELWDVTRREELGPAIAPASGKV